VCLGKGRASRAAGPVGLAVVLVRGWVAPAAGPGRPACQQLVCTQPQKELSRGAWAPGFRNVFTNGP